MTKALVIVESPAKARTISRYLGAGFVVESSIGHIRDLPSTAAEIPAKLKRQPWARLGVDVEHGFQPLYIVPKSKSSQVKKLRERLRNASELYLATDEDREGEAIAWHLVEVLKPSCPVKRMVFHEITRAAIAHALENTRDIDLRLVNAQETRRILDRLVGYEVSPLLWRKLRPKLSAGRVQSVATRLVVERERARMGFAATEFWSVEAELRTARAELVGARLAELDGQRLAIRKDFDYLSGELRSRGLRILDGETARAVRAELASAEFRVAGVGDKPFTSRPYPPFMTSTLQQEAGRKLRFSAQRTMRLAQSLYENGFITYMRTDSTTLSGEAIRAARAQATELYGSEYVPERPRLYTRRSRTAQEAHEAIRPAGAEFRKPSELKGTLEPDQLKLYELIWKRTLASQMKDAEGVRSTVRIITETTSHGTAVLTAQGKVLSFPGFMRAYVEGSDDPGAELADQERVLPALTKGERLQADKIEALQRGTQPPARYTEASLVRELETRGIGRPSTYATIIETIQERGYVWHKGPALVPTFTAFAVVQLLEQHLRELVDYDFTARMEDQLDTIASGECEIGPWLHEFYFGASEGPGNGCQISGQGLRDLIEASAETIVPQEVSRIALGQDIGGDELTVRIGRWGPYVQVGDDTQRRVTVPDDLPPDELTADKVEELMERAANGSRPLGHDPDSGKPVYLKNGRYGPYVQLGDPELDDRGKVKRGGKAKMASLWPQMAPESVTLDDALRLLSFPRQLGVHPDTGEPITAQQGRFGPFLRMGEENRSLASYEELDSVTLEQAVELFRRPKGQRRSRAASVLAELGPHPSSGAPVVVKTGRYGPYVTDGTVNATIPRGTEPDSLTLEQAVGLLSAREDKIRAQGEDPRVAKPKRGGRRTKRKR